MNVNTLTKSKWLKAADVEDDAVFTIAGVQMEEIGMDEQKENKAVLYFEELDKGLILNKTNIDTLAQLFGDETDDWAGKRIGLFIAPATFKGKTVESIRIKTRLPKAATQAALSQPKPSGFQRPQPQQRPLEDDDDLPI